MFRLAPIGGPIGGCLLIVLPRARERRPGQEGAAGSGAWSSPWASAVRKTRRRLVKVLARVWAPTWRPCVLEVGEALALDASDQILTGRVDGAHFRAVVPIATAKYRKEVRRSFTRLGAKADSRVV